MRFDALDDVVGALEPLAREHLAEPWTVEVDWSSGGEYSVVFLHIRNDKPDDSVRLDASGGEVSLDVPSDPHVEAYALRYDSSGSRVFVDALTSYNIGMASYPRSLVKERRVVGELDAPERFDGA